MAKVRCGNHKCIYNKKAYEEEQYSECTLDGLVFLDSFGECEEAEYAEKDGGQEVSMKTQRKLLTDEQREKICKAYGYNCYKCPIMKKFDDVCWCTINVKRMEDFIKEFWNEEIEVQDENS